MNKLLRVVVVCVVSWYFLAASYPASGHAQGNISFERDRGRIMLKVIKEDIKKNYFDPNYKGVNIEERFKIADDRLREAQSIGQIFGIIAQALLDFEDSHTFFIPPSRSDKVEYGWQMQAIGDKCFVIAVKPGSDAEAKGLKPGDEILAVSGISVSRDILWKLSYLIYQLRPAPGLRVQVRKPDGAEVQLDIIAKVTRGKRIIDLSGGDGGNDIYNLIREAQDEDRLNAHRYITAKEGPMIWKMPEFNLDETGVSDNMDKVRKHESLILDLRGNPGGYVKTLEWLAGYFFDKEIKIADLKGRKEMKPHIAKPRGNKVFKGKLVVLVDSKSGSAAELFARIVQLEKRGVVVGDRTSGAVMRSRTFNHDLGNDTVIFYSASVTDADLIMSDGKSLEGVGVMPDELLLPSPADMAAKRDPVLAKAAELVGVKLTPEQAGEMFPIQWKK